MIKSLYRKLLSEKQRLALHYAFFKLAAVWLRGNRYECCCCGKSSRRFLSHGDKGPRKNIKCPHCLSLERTRILCMYLQNEILNKAERPISILHFAPVKGLKDFLKESPIVSVYHDADINPNVATYPCDITQMPYADNTFDLIICSHVLYCVPEDRKGMSEIHRVLKPGGRVLLVDTWLDGPTQDLSQLPAQERKAISGDPMSCRLYGREDILETLRGFGLEGKIIDYTKQLSPEFIERQSLHDAFDSEIIDCVKCS